MCRLTFLFLALLCSSLQAALWKDDTFGCTANLPESAGWQPLPAPAVPGITTLVAMINPQRDAVFGVTVLNAPPTQNLHDPATVKTIETMLRGFGYDFVGSSTTVIGGLEWKQYPVKSSAGGRPMTGVVRYASGNGKIFGVSMLLGGGKEAVQDMELQGAAASFRLFRPLLAQAAPVSPGAPVTPGAPAPTTGTDTPPAKTKPEPTAGEPDYMRLGLYAAGGVVVLFILLKLVGGGSGGASPPGPNRRR